MKNTGMTNCNQSNIKTLRFKENVFASNESKTTKILSKNNVFITEIFLT